MERDRRKGPGEFVGIFDFTDTLHKEQSRNNMATTTTMTTTTETVNPQNGLLQGGTYHYYYSLNGMTEYYDPAQPTTTACPILPGQVVNVCDVPAEQPLSPASTTALYRPDEPPSWWTLNPRDRYSALKPRPKTAHSAKGASPTQPVFSPNAQPHLSPPTSSQQQSPEKPRTRSARSSSIRSFIRSTFRPSSKSKKSDTQTDRFLQSEPRPAKSSMAVELPPVPKTACGYGPAKLAGRATSVRSMGSAPVGKSGSRKTVQSTAGGTNLSPSLTSTALTLAERRGELLPIEALSPLLAQGLPSKPKRDSTLADWPLVSSDQPGEPATAGPDNGSAGRGLAKPDYNSILPAFEPLPQLNLSLHMPAQHSFRPQLVRSAFSEWTEASNSTNGSTSPAVLRNDPASLGTQAAEPVRDRSRFLSSPNTRSTAASPLALEEYGFSRQQQAYGSPGDCNSPGPLVMSKGTTTATSFGSPVFSLNNSEAVSPKFMLAESYMHSESLDDLVTVDSMPSASSGFMGVKNETPTLLGPPSAVPERVSKDSSRFITPVFLEKSNKRLCQYAGIRDKPMPAVVLSREEPGDYFSCKDIPSVPYRPFNQALDEERELEELRSSVSELLRQTHPHYFDSRPNSGGTRTPGRLDMPPSDDDFAEEFSFLRLVVN